MSTTTSLFNINFATIESELETASKYFGFIGGFIPGAAPLLAIVPMIEEGLKIAAAVQANWGNPEAVVEAIVQGLTDMSTKVAATRPAVQAAAIASLPQANPVA